MSAVFFAGAFLAAGLAAVFAGAFFAAGFAAAFAAGLAAALAGATFLVAVSLMPASLATFEREAFRLAAVFLLRTFFFTAVSTALCAAERLSAVGFARKLLVASFRLRFVAMFRSRRWMVCFARLIADLMIGMKFLYLLNAVYTSMGYYSGK